MRRTKAYLVYTSAMKEPVKIDEEELDKIAEGSKRMGTLVFLKKGSVNTSHIVGIVEDASRINEWLRQCEYGVGQGERYNAEGIRPLRHMYGEGSQIGALIEMRMKELEVGQLKQIS